MYKGTTPTFIFTFTDFDPTQAEEIILTFSVDQKTPLLEKHTEDLTIESDNISVALTQEETINFPKGNMYCQFNFKYSDGSRVASAICSIDWANNLHREVM